MGERCERQGTSGRVEDVNGDQRMADRPYEPAGLILRSACPRFFVCWYGEGGRESKRRSRWWFEEDLMLGGNGTVFISMTSALANVLFNSVSICKRNSLT